MSETDLGRPFPVRDVRTGVSAAAVPKHWHPAGRSVSIFFDNLSILFPEGERFFIRSVRRYAREVNDLKDAPLAEAMRSFAAQEGIHTREHIAYNDMLRAHGHPVDALERRVTWLLGRGKRLPPRVQLAITVALEHFTANLGHLLLRDPRLLEGAHPSMARLWKWHAVEECEHKLVAHRVFERVGGTYRERFIGMAIAGTLLWAVVGLHQAAMMRADGTVLSAKQWWSLFRYLWIHPGGMHILVGRTLGYFRRDHDPAVVDDVPFIDAWRVAANGPPVP